MTSLDQIRAYYRAKCLDEQNKVLTDEGKPPLEKLGGFTYDEQLKLEMITPLTTGWFHNGYRYFYVSREGRMVV